MQWCPSASVDNELDSPKQDLQAYAAGLCGYIASVAIHASVRAGRIGDIACQLGGRQMLLLHLQRPGDLASISSFREAGAQGVVPTR